LVPDRHLESRELCQRFGANDMEAIGPFLAAVVIDVLGIRAALMIDVATFWFRLRC